MIDKYIQFAVDDDKNKLVLVKIAEFVHKEAKMALKAGVIKSDLNVSNEPDSNMKTTQPSRNLKKPVFATNVSENIENLSKSNETLCAYCGRKNHKIVECNDFLRIPIAQRWKLAKTARLCYKCLNKGHGSARCKNSNCRKCGRNHHELLHQVFPTNPVRENHLQTCASSSANISPPIVNNTD